MSDPRPKCDVVIVGLGWAGSVMAEDLARAGLNVVAIERGAWRDTSTDFAPNVDADELRWDTRRAMLRPPSAEALTFRNKPDEEALPVRDWSCFEFGFNVGGAGTHWAAMAWRFTPYDFQPYSTVVKRYGKAQFTDGLQVQDWGVTYDDLEPYYDRFEKIAGVSGKAGVLNGQVIEGGNPFEGNRTNDFPMPPLESSRLIDLFDDGAKSIGLHPFRVPAGNASRPYVNSLGLRMGPCSYCGYCLYYGCGNWSKSSPQTCVLPALMKHKTFTLITNAEVTRVNLADDKKTATGVTYIDEHGDTQVQPASIVILTAFQMDNVRLMLLSGVGAPYNHKTGEGTVGRNYCFQTVSGANLFFEDEKLNTFAGAGAFATGG